MIKVNNSTAYTNILDMKPILKIKIWNKAANSSVPHLLGDYNRHLTGYGCHAQGRLRGVFLQSISHHLIHAAVGTTHPQVLFHTVILRPL